MNDEGLWFTIAAMSLLIKNACIFTCDQDIVIPDGYLEIKDNQITGLGKMSAFPVERTAHGAWRIIDAHGRVVMPGFVNPHMHLYSQFAKGLNLPKMASFLEVLECLWWKLDKALKEEDIYLSAYLGLIESIRSGVTTVIDHHASYGSIKGSLTAVAEAFSETGMRGALCFEVSDRNGEKDCKKAIEENVSFLEEVAEKCMSPSYLLRGMFGLHASFTLSPATIKKVHEANEKFGAPYHIHVAEGEEDAADAKARYNFSVVRRLYDEGVLREGTIAAHCVHVNDVDIELIKKSGAFVVHNPVSNMNNAVGRMHYLKMCAAGLSVGIGTDGMGSGVFTDIKAASVLHKEAAGNPQAGWNEVHMSALKTNPSIPSHLFGKKLGVIAGGAEADVIISDYIPSTEVKADNYWGHTLFGVVDSRVHSTIVGGRVLMEGFKLEHIDEAAIIKEARKLSTSLWKRFEK